jgi:hypothetical protein
LQHLSGPSAKAGISINGEAVVNNEHTLYLIRLAGQSRPMTRLHREE